MKLTTSRLLLLYVLILLLAAILFPTPTDWSPKYGSIHKDPLGTYVLFNMLPELFPAEDIILATQPIYNSLQLDSAIRNYLFVNDDFYPDYLDQTYLLEFITAGGNAFIAAEQFDYEFSDTIGFEAHRPYQWIRPLDQDSLRNSLYLEHHKFRSDSIDVHSSLLGAYVSAFDSTAIWQIEILGKNDNGDINFFRKQIGHGYLYIHLCPASFTNYELLYQNTGTYVSNCLSYIPYDQLLVDDYYKSGHSQNDSSLSVLFAHPPMRWAWNIALFGTLLFMFFGARRKSRAIPVIRPYRNDSIHFIETVGAMYYGRRDNQLMANKRLNQFENYLKYRYRLNSIAWERSEIAILHERTGLNQDRWETWIQHVKHVRNASRLKSEELRAFSIALDNLYQSLKYKKNV